VNKGDCGKALVVGGSLGMSGSVCLAASSALRMGAGLVYLAVPESIADVVDKKFTEGITLALPDVDGALSELCLDELLEALERVDALILGPGMKVTPDTCAVVQALLKASRVPVVVDADGLNCLAQCDSLRFLKKLQAPVALTPHPGEMARLCKTGIPSVQANRLNTARAFAVEHRVTVALKGAYTIIAAPSGEVYVNPTGNAGMATAGSGDVLTGIIGALLGEGVEAFPAAVCGAYIHGLAGDACAQQRGERAVTAGSISAALTHVVKKLEDEKQAR
jgi:NAD(P)H-hydrate epimerase